jgi:hypothetical protein
MIRVALYARYDTSPISSVRLRSRISYGCAGFTPKSRVGSLRTAIATVLFPSGPEFKHCWLTPRGVASR